MTTPYAGEAIWIRFEYVTDDAANASGWLIDDLQIPAIGYSTDFESDLAGWESEGWLLTDNCLRSIGCSRSCSLMGIYWRILNVFPWLRMAVH
ncbi:MAG: hypothetical protein R2932_19840 [Caldilineaceae bacterium]